jgi:hypothetical protein
MNRLALEQAVKGKEVFSSYLQVKLCVNSTHELCGCSFNPFLFIGGLPALAVFRPHYL